MFYVEINNNKITCKGVGDFKTDTQIEVTEEIYNALTNLPADYTMDGETVISVSPLPIAKKTTVELREHAYESMLTKEDGTSLIVWEGRAITVDQANKIYLEYSAEGSSKATEIQALIVEAKTYIRELYPEA